MRSAAPPVTPSRQVRVVLSTTALVTFLSVWKAAALALAELGISAFFVVGIARSVLGETAPWYVLAACLVAPLVRAIDIEGWGYFVTGGLAGRAEKAFGNRMASVASAASLTERFLLIAITTVLCGQYAVSFGAAWMAEWSVTARLTIQELVTVGAIILIGLIWTRNRFGLYLSQTAVAKLVWVGIGLILVVIGLAAMTVARHPIPFLGMLVPPQELASISPKYILRWLTGFALVLPVLGGGDALARAAHEFPPPRLKSLRRTSLFVSIFIFITLAFSSFLYVSIVPKHETPIWAATPLQGIVQHIEIPAWALGFVTFFVLASALLMLIPAAQAALDDAEQMLRHASAQRARSEGLGPATQAKIPSAPINVAAAAAVLIVFSSGAQITWLSRAYGMSIAAVLLVKIAVLVRLRSAQGEQRPFTAPVNLRLGKREMPLGAIALGLIVGAASLAMLLYGDIPSIAATGLIAGIGVVMLRREPEAESGVEEEEAPFQLSTAPDVSLGQLGIKPGNVLVPVRHAHALSPVRAALHEAGDREVVVMTIRVLGLDVDDEAGGGSTSTPDERHLFSQVVALTERYGRPVRLLIVPAQNVFEGTIAVALRLFSSEVHVGESSTLSTDEQARLLGEAWERADKPKNQHLRLVIHRNNGRTDSYHLGAHAPSLSPNDLDLIHRVWLDAVKAVGPHVHHHDVVRAALTQMEQQLTGTQREEALDMIRSVARPADEIAAAVHAKDYSRVRDLARNRHASDLAVALTELGVEDQVVVFRVLPRKDAATVFEYLTREQQEALLRAMAQEDVATLLNNMAPDDRTTFLEELPASVTRQLLTLLTPKERSVALTLLGYPDESIGRLMTPHYVAVHEDWTVREVLDYIRTHGQDSETLNVVYVVDEQGLLVDDIRIRELLLTSPENRVVDLMDRRFVALKATDDQKEAVAIFKQYDRTALPVTDTSGMLIGIVTIDDVLDVAEAAATKEIQKIGGSEALDEPYMKIAFVRMIQKRAGWLTALFLGEMLTATAMGAFEAEIAKAVTLALFVPLIISSGGNSGSQASTLVIRALALGEVGLLDWWRVIRREVMAGLTLGAILGAIGFLRISIWSAFSNIYGEHWLLIAITVGISLIGVVLWGTLVGSLLPFILRRMGFDPATSSAPFVATLVDVTGLVIYFTVALIILKGTLL